MMLLQSYQNLARDALSIASSRARIHECGQFAFSKVGASRIVTAFLPKSNWHGEYGHSLDIGELFIATIVIFVHHCFNV